MSRTVAGVDVGGPRKGYHAVALRAGKVVAKFRSRDAEEIATWLRGLGAEVVAIDAPCRWREENGPARAAERQMAGAHISSFSTPTEAKAAGHAFYTWMLEGMKLYRALLPTHPIYDGTRRMRVCIETFPQAVACALAAEIVSAKEKDSVRRGLLERWGLAPAQFANIDEVDAALCAVAADAFACDRFHGYGDPAGGFVIVPADWLS
jgi:predicted nuclease with RNAse H fold